MAIFSFLVIPPLLLANLFRNVAPLKACQHGSRASNYSIPSRARPSSPPQLKASISEAKGKIGIDWIGNKRSCDGLGRVAVWPFLQANINVHAFLVASYSKVFILSSSLSDPSRPGQKSFAIHRQTIQHTRNKSPLSKGWPQNHISADQVQKQLANQPPPFLLT